jgi:hypothetical protein
MGWGNKFPDMKNDPTYLEGRLSNAETQLAQSASQISTHTTQIAANATAISNIGNASPKGTYATLTALQTAFPTGTTGIYVVTADGGWYYWNGTAWTKGGTYQSTGISNKTVDPNKTTFLETYTNLFDQTKVGTGVVSNANGTIVAGSSYSYSDYIAVTPNTSYTISKCYDMAFYDSNKAYVSGVSPGGQVKTVMSPTNAAYLRVTFANTDLSTSMLSNSPLPSVYFPYGVNMQIVDSNFNNTINNSISTYKTNNPTTPNQTTFFTESVKNLFDKGKTLTGVVSGADGTIVTGNAYVASDYIPVTVGLTYNSTSHYDWAYYDANKTYISGGSFAVNSFTIPAGVAYIRITYALSAKDTSSFTQDSITTLSFSKQDFTDGVAKAVQQSKTYIPKKIVFLGDSITADPTWWTANMLNRLYFDNFMNLARSGARWAHTAGTIYDITSNGGSATDENVIWNQVNKLIDKINNGLTPVPDVVAIYAGTNDQLFNSNYGDVSAAFSGTITERAANTILTVAEAIRYDCEILLNNYPKLQIILATPIQRGIADNTPIFSLGDIIKGCGGIMGNRVIDQGKESGIYGFYEVSGHKFLLDGIHPNMDGREKLGAFNAIELKNAICV